MIADAAATTQFVVAALAAIGVFIAIGSAVVVRSKATGLTDSVDVLSTANTTQRSIIADMELDKVRQATRCEAEKHEIEVRYVSRIKTLEGKLEVMTGDLAAQIVAATKVAAERLDEARRSEPDK